MLYHSCQTAERNSEEGGDDVKSAWPLCPGLHTRYNGWYSRWQWGDPELILKTILSTDGRLKPACMKAELLVTAYQHGAVNTFSGLVHTARHVMKVGNT